VAEDREHGKELLGSITDAKFLEQLRDLSSHEGLCPKDVDREGAVIVSQTPDILTPTRTRAGSVS
jgi:hypothetical protein